MKAKARKDLSKLKDYSAQGEPLIKYRFETSSSSLCYFYFQNGSNDTRVTATVQIVDIVDAEVMEPFAGSRSPEVIVNPGEEKIVLIQCKSDQAQISARVAASFKKGAAGSGGSGSFGGGYGGNSYGNYGGGNSYGGNDNYY